MESCLDHSHAALPVHNLLFCVDYTLCLSCLEQLWLVMPGSVTELLEQLKHFFDFRSLQTLLMP